MITDAFLTVDMLFLKLWLHERTSLTVQTEIHHYIAFCGFTGSLVAGFGMGGSAITALLCEVSNIFLLSKDMFFTKETRNSCLAQLNQIAFFISYSVLRIYLFPVCIYYCLHTWWAVGSLIPWYRNFFMLTTTLLAIAVTILNLYWYKIILKGLKRLF